MKWAILLRLSTTDSIESWPSGDGGRPVIKSIDMTDHLRDGMAKGCNKPAGFWERDLDALQRGHVST